MWGRPQCPPPSSHRAAAGGCEHRAPGIRCHCQHRGWGSKCCTAAGWLRVGYVLSCAAFLLAVPLGVGEAGKHFGSSCRCDFGWKSGPSGETFIAIPCFFIGVLLFFVATPRSPLPLHFLSPASHLYSQIAKKPGRFSLCHPFHFPGYLGLSYNQSISPHSQLICP